MTKNSFTLIELLVVIAIIGVLSSIVLVSLSGTRDRANVAKVLLYSSQVYHALGSDIVGNWNLDEGSGTTARDFSGYNNHGTISGATYTTNTPHLAAGQGSGKYALSFDGVNDYVSFSKTLDITGTFTAEAWFKRKGPSGGTIANGYHTIIDNIAGDSHRTRILPTSDGSSILFEQRNAAGAQCQPTWSGQPLGDNNWHHIVYTFDGSYMRLYTDGQSQGSPYSCNGLTRGPTPPRIGAYDTVGEHYITNGFIDDVRVYSRALTAFEIQQHYVEGLEKHKTLTIK